MHFLTFKRLKRRIRQLRQTFANRHERNWKKNRYCKKCLLSSNRNDQKKQNTNANVKTIKFVASSLWRRMNHETKNRLDFGVWYRLCVCAAARVLLRVRNFYNWKISLSFFLHNLSNGGALVRDCLLFFFHCACAVYTVLRMLDVRESVNVNTM